MVEVIAGGLVGLILGILMMVLVSPRVELRSPLFTPAVSLPQRVEIILRTPDPPLTAEQEAEKLRITAEMTKAFGAQD